MSGGNITSGAVHSIRPRVDLPHNYDAEQAFLAACLVNNEVFHEADQFLRPEHFADAVHGRIYEAIGVIVGKGQIADPVTLKNQFDQDGALATVGGAEYLVKLAIAVVTVISARDYLHLPMLVKTDIKRLVAAFGEPDSHGNPRERHADIWTGYRRAARAAKNQAYGPI
jgi:replicative DNA helicase